MLKPKIHFVLGPTCSGKSGMAISMAKKISAQKNQAYLLANNSETGAQNTQKLIDFQNLQAVVINCDSRQIYRQNRIGSCLVEGQYKKMMRDLERVWGQSIEELLAKNSDLYRLQQSEQLDSQVLSFDSQKAKQEDSRSNASVSVLEPTSGKLNPFQTNPENSFWNTAREQNSLFESEGVVHFLVDFLDLNYHYSLLLFVQDFCFLYQILSKLGCTDIILTGGTVLYAKAILERYELSIPKFGFDQQATRLKQEVEGLSRSEMQQKLTKAKPNHGLNNSEYNNPQRLKRHLIKELGKDIYQTWKYPFTKDDFGDVVILRPSFESIQDKIWARIDFWLEGGALIGEAQKIKQEFGIQKLTELGLSYLPCLDYLQSLENVGQDISLEGLREAIFKKNKDYFEYQQKFYEKLLIR